MTGEGPPSHCEGPLFPIDFVGVVEVVPMAGRSAAEARIPSGWFDLGFRPPLGRVR
jgi:hypothetical protein